MRSGLLSSSFIVALSLGLGLASDASGTPLPANARLIQNAVDRARPGTVIELPEGPIEGELRVNKPVVIRGAGKDRTVYLSRGHRPALVIGANFGEVVLEGVTFTTQAGTKGHRGAGVMLHGPAKITLRDVALRRTITGRCLTAAITLAHDARVRMERVEVENHDCFVAGALVVGPGDDIELVETLLSRNSGELAGAILMTGGRLRIERSILRDNRYTRGQDGHHLTVTSSPSRIELIASEMATDRGQSIAFEVGVTPDIAVERMDWPEGDAPSFVRSFAY